MVALPANSENPGSVQAREEYFPYGKASDRRDERNRYRYVGVERDEATGLTMTGPRTLDVGTCRFLQPDPIGSNRPYCYAQCNPLRLLDASGYSAEEGQARSRREPELSGEEQAVAEERIGLKKTRQVIRDRDSRIIDGIGLKLGLWWLFGGGKKREVDDDRWASYLKADKVAEGEDRKGFTDGTQQLIVGRAIALEAGFAKPGEFETRRHVDLAPGELFTGHNFLGGSHRETDDNKPWTTEDVTYSGVVEWDPETGIGTYDLEIVWHDVMDVNERYKSDIRKAYLAYKLIPGTPVDYQVEITVRASGTFRLDPESGAFVGDDWPFSPE